MLRQRFYIAKYDWKVVVLYGVDYRDKDYVLDILTEICDNPDILRKAYIHMVENHKNTGFTYSDYDTHRSLIVISKTTSNSELFNTIVHEIDHLQSHIATTFNFDVKSEQAAYLIGGIAKTMYKTFNKIIQS